jgi:hypothetical protein
MATINECDTGKVDDLGGLKLHPMTHPSSSTVDRMILSQDEKEDVFDEMYDDGDGHDHGHVSGSTKEIPATIDVILVSTNEQDESCDHSRRNSGSDGGDHKYCNHMVEDDVEANNTHIFCHQGGTRNDSHKNEECKALESDNHSDKKKPIVQRDGNCLPTLQEIQHSDHHVVKKQPSLEVVGCQSKRTIIVSTAATVVIIVALLMTLILSKQMLSSSSFIDTSTSPSDLRFTSQYQSTMEYLVQNKVSSSTSLMTYGTPQYYATSYIANQLQLPVPTSLPSSALPSDVRLRQQQAYRYIARYVLALDYFHFTNYNETRHDSLNQKYTNDNKGDQGMMIDAPQFLNFVTSGMDICQWNIRNNQASSMPDTDIVDYYDTNSIQMGVTCSMSTKLPVNLTISKSPI